MILIKHNAILMQLAVSGIGNIPDLLRIYLKVASSKIMARWITPNQVPFLNHYPMQM